MSATQVDIWQRGGACEDRRQGELEGPGLLGFWLIARGVVEIVLAFMAEGRTSWMVVFSGALWVVGGLVILVVNPFISAGALTLTLGLFAILWGGFSLAAGLDVRSAEKPKESTDA